MERAVRVVEVYGLCVRRQRRKREGLRWKYLATTPSFLLCTTARTRGFIASIAAATSNAQHNTIDQCFSWVGKRAGCKRNWAQSSARTTKIRAQFSTQTTQNLLRVNDQNLVLWAIDENIGTNLQAFYKHFYIGCLKTQKQQLKFVKIKK